MVHTFLVNSLVNRRRHYGTGSSPERHHDRGSPSSDTTELEDTGSTARHQPEDGCQVEETLFDY
jgi:hypothetical protein